MQSYFVPVTHFFCQLISIHRFSYYFRRILAQCLQDLNFTGNLRRGNRARVLWNGACLFRRDS